MGEHMKRLTVIALVTALTGCTWGGGELPRLVALPDGTTAYTARANSGPFMVGKITEEQVVQDYVKNMSICPGPAEIIKVQREQPWNNSLVIVTAIFRCQGGATPRGATVPPSVSATAPEKLPVAPKMLAGPDPYPQAYALRGFKLGMTLDEFRAMPHPDAQKLENPRVICTGEIGEMGARGAWELKVSKVEQAAGVVRCNHFATDRKLSRPETAEVNLNVAGVGVYQTFDFAPSPVDGVTRLYRIAIRSNMDYWDQFLAAYVEKFGKPTEVRSGTVQNKLGNAFDKATAVWLQKESSITLEARTTKIDLMGITYLLHDVAAQVSRQAEGIEGKPSDKL